MRPELVAEAVTPRTRAVLAVHLFGRPVAWEELQTAVPQDVALVEDAAGALGARYRGTPCGALGLLAACRSIPGRSSRPAREAPSRRTRRSSPHAVRRLRHHGIAAGSPVDIAGAGLQLPPPRRPLRARDPAAGAARVAPRGARAGRRLVRRAPRPPRRDTRPRTRATGTAGRRTSSRSTAGTRHWQGSRAAGSRRRSGRTRSTGSPRIATAAPSPARTRPSSERWRSRSRRRCPRTTSTACARPSRASPSDGVSARGAW